MTTRLPGLRLPAPGDAIRSLSNFGSLPLRTSRVRAWKSSGGAQAGTERDAAVAPIGAKQIGHETRVQRKDDTLAQADAHHDSRGTALK